MRHTNCAPRTRNHQRVSRKPIFRSTIPSTNIFKEGNVYNVELALPGFSKKDIDLQIKDDVLIIKSNVDHTDKKKNYKFREFDYSSFERSFSLSKDSDQENITANFKHGILTIQIPDLPVVPAKKIDIK